MWNAAMKKARSCDLAFVKTGAAGRNRTHDPLVRSQVLYPAELQPPEARIIAAKSDFAKGGTLVASSNKEKAVFALFMTSA